MLHLFGVPGRLGQLSGALSPLLLALPSRHAFGLSTGLRWRSLSFVQGGPARHRQSAGYENRKLS